MAARFAALRRRVRHWIDPFEKYKYEAMLERQRRKAVAFGLLYGWPRLSAEDTKAVVAWVNKAVPRQHERTR